MKNKRRKTDRKVRSSGAKKGLLVKTSELIEKISGKILGSKKNSILQTLLIGFLIPVVLMIILGVVSYNTASSGMLSKYQESAVSTVNITGKYFNLICTNITSKALELVGTGDVGAYYKACALAPDGEAPDLMADARTELGNAKAVNTNIFSYSIIPEKGTYLTSLTGKLSENPHDDFVKSPEGQYFAQTKGARNAWLGYHTYIDQHMSHTQPEDYAMVFYQRLSKGDSYLMFDIGMPAVTEMLQGMDFGDNSIKAVVTKDGREVISVQGKEEEPVEETYFVGQKFFEDSKAETEAKGVDVKIKGKKYLYISTPVGQTGAMICVLIPQSNLLGQVSAIKYITIIMVLIAGALSLLIGLMIAMGISRTVKSMTMGLSKVAEGDLSCDFETKRRDEFGTLTNSLNKMLSSIRILIRDMQQFSTKVKDMASDVSVRTDNISNSVRDTSQAMDDMTAGIQSQAQETESSNAKMNSLSANIETLTNRTSVMGTSADKAIEAVGQGKVIVQSLNEKSSTTVDLTKILVEDISDVSKSASEITSFVEIINSIAEQTNLLSLNASIEAARAGEAGRGFAVVAEEIRKLADQSKDSGDKIKGIVANIGTTTQKTTDSAKKAEEMIVEQAESLEETVRVFGQIQGCVDELVEGMRVTLDKLAELSREKTAVQDSIQNISAISQEAAASTEEVTATMSEQAGIISELAVRVVELSDEAGELNRSIAQFHLADDYMTGESVE